MTELDGSGATKEVLEFRRCIVIAVVGSTPVESAPVKMALDSGYLSQVKTWYDQILQGKVGRFFMMRITRFCDSGARQLTYPLHSWASLQ